MRKTRRKRITVETERLWVVARGGRRAPAWCEACRAEVQMLCAEEAAALTGLGQRAIFRRVEDGRLHFTEDPSGTLLICLNSLMNETRADG
ncbi:MAG TPA: hypothetical protein VGC87_21275 [Pyrinomonadaceae bacterium]